MCEVRTQKVLNLTTFSTCKLGRFSFNYLLSNYSQGYGFYLRLSVCLSAFPHDISKTDADRQS